MGDDVKVWVMGVGAVAFGKHLDLSLRDLAENAALAAISDAGLTPGDIEAVFFSNSAAGIVTGQESIRGQTALRGAGLMGKPIFNVENACASGSSAFILARTGIVAGMWSTVLVVGAEKMAHVDRSIPYKALAAASDISELEGQDASGKSVFMELYAEKTRAYMRRSGATQDDFARIVVKDRANAAHNPIAQFRSPTSLDAVIGSGEVAWPLTKFMCSPISDGAAALVLYGAPAPPDFNGRPAVQSLASHLRSGSADDPESTLPALAALVYEEAGLGPEDIDVVELHDAAAPAELEYAEGLGLCSRGEGPVLLRSGATALGGRVPINPSGGLIGRGHPVGATGVAQLGEIVTQLRGEADRRQVDGARIGLVHNAGGDVGGTPAAVAVHLLARRSRP